MKNVFGEARASQTLLSASGMMPIRFLSQEDIGYALRREFFLHRRGLFALDQRQTGLLVQSDDRRRVRLRIGSSGQTPIQQVRHYILEFPPFLEGAKLHSLYEGIWEIEGGLHETILLVSQLPVNLDRPRPIVILRGVA